MDIQEEAIVQQVLAVESVTTDYRDAVGGTGSGGCGFFNGWEYRSHGGNGATGRISIAIPRIFTDANHHTFTPLFIIKKYT